MTTKQETERLADFWANHINTPAFAAVASEIAALQRQGVDLSPDWIAGRLGIPVELLMQLAAEVAGEMSGNAFGVIKVPPQGKPN